MFFSQMTAIIAHCTKEGSHMKLTDHIHLIGSGAIAISGLGDCNVYAITSQGETALVDCGLSYSPRDLLHNLQQDGIPPQSIRCVLLTHAHPDHVNSAPAFQEMGIPLYASQLTAQIMKEGIEAFYHTECLAPSSFRSFMNSMSTCQVDRILRDEETICIGSLSLKVIYTPAHSPDSTCFLLYDGKTKHLFSGDTLFYPGHINYFSRIFSCVDGYPESIQKLAMLQPDGLFPGHALFTVSRAQICTQAALKAIENGTLPPLKPYS